MGKAVQNVNKTQVVISGTVGALTGAVSGTNGIKISSMLSPTAKATSGTTAGTILRLGEPSCLLSPVLHSLAIRKDRL